MAMKDKKTGLTFRTLRAVDKFVGENIIKNNPKYSWTQALRDSGYPESTIKTHASKMYWSSGVQKKIQEYRHRLEEKVLVTVDRIQQELQEVKELARESKDLPTMVRCIEGKAKTIGAFKDVVDTKDLTKRDEITEEIRKEAEEIAKIRLLQSSKSA